MSAMPPLQPTLWRTCRVLANRTRLQILQWLADRPSQTVSTVAARLDLPLPVASQYLRALEARGLLTCRRIRQRVNYRWGSGEATSVQGLVRVLRQVFEHESSPVEMLFKSATAFTHPRRIEIFRALHAQSRTMPDLRAFTGISTRALMRHVGKLEARGFVSCHAGYFAVSKPPDLLGRELARMAAA
jgi:DNA-binding transcriptional ArsR family regulator